MAAEPGGGGTPRRVGRTTQGIQDRLVGHLCLGLGQGAGTWVAQRPAQANWWGKVDMKRRCELGSALPLVVRAMKHALGRAVLELVYRAAH